MINGSMMKTISVNTNKMDERWGIGKLIPRE
jgi:hypothetical protein